LFCDYIDKKIKESEIESLPGVGASILEMMETDPYKFYGTLSGQYEQGYYDTPILKYINPSKFVETFLSISSDCKSIVIHSLDKRYEFGETNKKLIEELNWLKKVQSIMKKSKINLGKNLAVTILNL